MCRIANQSSQTTRNQKRHIERANHYDAPMPADILHSPRITRYIEEGRPMLRILGFDAAIL